MSHNATRIEEVDLARLERWMVANGLGSGPLREPRLLAGGTQNIIVQFRFGSRVFVLRKASRTAHGNGNETMRREARLLQALADTPVPHARLIASCPDEQELDGTFYLMEPIDGFNPGMGLPETHKSSPDYRRRMGFALIDGLASLRQVDYQAVGLTDFGHPEGFLERQVKRWQSQLQSYGRYESWPGAGELPAVHAIGEWLDQHRPVTFEPGIQHGDFHIKNVLFRHDSSEIAAIVDWELATIGDPMIDLGWLMATWQERDGTKGGAPFEIQPWEGFPTSDELVTYYAEKTGANVSGANWYGVFACYKLALILEGTYARACAGGVDMELGQTFHGNAVNLLQRARRWME